MKVSKMYILALVFMTSVSVMGVVGVVYTAMDFFNLLSTQLAINSTPGAKMFFRGASVMFSSMGILGLYLYLKDGEKYYKNFSIDAVDFKTSEYLNCYTIKVNGMAWYLTDWQKKCFIKKLKNSGKVNFTQYYTTKKNPTTLIKHG